MKHVFESFIIVLLILLSIPVSAQELLVRTGSATEKINPEKSKVQPFNPEDTEILQWDDGTSAFWVGVAAGGTFQVSARFSSDVTEPYTGYKLTQVEIYLEQYSGLPTNCTIKIYDQGTPASPGELLLSQDVTSLLKTEWNRFVLNDPVEISGNDIWVGYEVTNLPGQAPAGGDSGPAVPDGDWFLTDYTGGWVRFSEFIPYYSFNWNIHALLEKGPGHSTNPNPEDLAVDVNINADLSWENPVDADSVEIFLGTSIENLTSVYSGTTVNTWDLGTLDYRKTYFWKVDETDSTGTTDGFLWKFTTVKDPNSITVFNEPFDSIGFWSEMGPLGMENWDTDNSSEAGGTAPELRLNWLPLFNGLTQLISRPISTTAAGINHTLLLQHKYEWWQDPAPVAGLIVTYDGGVSGDTIWQIQPVGGNLGPEIIEKSFVPRLNTFQLILYLNGDSYNFNYWYIDNILIDYIPTVNVQSYEPLVDEFSLSRNYPNPFNPVTTINFSLKTRSKVTLDIYNVLGQKVSSLLNKEINAGVHNVKFDGSDLPTGVYIYTLEADGADGSKYRSAKKMMLLK